MKILLISTLFCLYLSGAIPAAAQIHTEVNFNFADSIPHWLAENKVPCAAIGIIENGKLKYVKAFGELRQGAAAPDNAIFNVASMTKPVVAVLTLKLTDSGQWNLDEPLSNYWIDPDLAGDSYLKKLTTRYVLSHQSGFPNWRFDRESKKLGFDFEPGTKFQYSGEGYEYLRRALERKFEQPLEKLADSVLFKPLGLKDTRFFWDKNMDESRFAFWHDGQGNLYQPATPRNRGSNAAGSLITTIEDYAKFMIYVMNGAGLSANTFNDMIKPRTKVKNHIAFGLGWQIVADLPAGEYALEHGGSDQGVRTIGILLPQSKAGIVVLTNGDNGIMVYNHIITIALSTGQTILDYIYRSTETHQEITLSADVLNSYTGTYLQKNGKQFTLTREGNGLKSAGDGIPSILFIPETTTKFFLKDFDVQLELIDTAANSSLKAIIYEEGNLVAEAVKVR